jgi:hypothetical protein
MFKCQYCESTFTRLYNLQNHQKKAKYCKNIQNINCNYCNIKIPKEDINLHYSNCIEYFKYKYSECEKILFENNELKLKIKESNLYIEQIKELKQQNKELQDKLNDITLKLIEKSNNITNNYNNSKNNTTNNTKIDIFNQLTPLTDDDYKKHINNLTLEHIKKGAEGYADYALNYTLKDKLLCLDYSRKKICYKNEQGDKVEEYRLNTILPKLFKEIEPVNKEILLALMNNLNDDFLEYEKTITEFDEGDETDKEYSKKIEENQEQIMKYSEILGECYSISNGITNNKLGTEITDIVINKIPKK